MLSVVTFKINMLTFVMLGVIAHSVVAPLFTDTSTETGSQSGAVFEIGSYNSLKN
jgi:hypothetical protein